MFVTRRLVMVLVPLMCAWAGAQATQPTTKEAGSPQAEALLDNLRQSYSKLQSLELKGTVSLQLDAAGRQETREQEFTSSYQAPDRFRHEMKEDLLIVSDGSQAFVYKVDQKQYLSLDLPKTEGAEEFAPAIALQLVQQNPSLLLALSKDAGAALTEDAARIELGDDVEIDGAPMKVLKLDGDEPVQVAVDAKTGLVRRFRVDLKPYLESRGVPQVREAVITIDYAQSTPDAALNATAFTWEPPADAVLVKPVEGEELDAGDGPAMALVGQPAPDFKLPSLDGKQVTLAQLKGSVVVLDFWASWCGPCRISMPHLQQLYRDMSPQGVNVYAINLRESRPVAERFIETSGFTFPVLLDTSAEAADAYKVRGIPQTVVIGKDGTVKNVMIGYRPGAEAALRQWVEQAMKE